MTLVILLSLKTMESLFNGFATYFQVTPSFTMITESIASSQHCRRVYADAWLNEPLNLHTLFWLEPLRVLYERAGPGCYNAGQWGFILNKGEAELAELAHT